MSAHNQVNAAGRAPRKSELGQNFLVDTGAARRLVDALGDIGNSIVIEVGPGRGALTKTLAERAGRLVAVEFDRVLAEELRREFQGRANVDIVQANFLDISLSEFLTPGRSKSSQRLKVVGNIPYYITSDILLRLFEQNEWVDTIVVMVQREVADRLVAEPGSREYGLLTVTARLFSDIERLFTLPPGVFHPPPQVHSSVLRLRIAPKAALLGVDSQEFLTFCKLAFAQKRKTLFNNLRRKFAAPKIETVLHTANVADKVRAEALSLNQLAEIYRKLRG
jgi:16S rRNA (adenine1518-N6/adenine1519-N6)-dimethyltransferase